MSKKRILVVEDEEKFRRILKECLEPDYEVILAPSGEEGVALAKTIRPDGILLDLRLPGMDGFDVLRTLKMSPETVRIPVMIVSATGWSGSLMDAEWLGAVDYLLKPVSLSDIREAVQRYI